MIYDLWFVFYDDLVDELNAHFEAGGTLEDLNRKSTHGSTSAIYYCVNEMAEKCFPVLMEHITEIDVYIWCLCFSVSRIEYIREFIRRGYYPPSEIARETNDQRGKHVITGHFCSKATIVTLCISHRSKQPMSHLWKKISRMVWSTRKCDQWLDCLPE